MQATLLKGLDGFIYPEGCLLASLVPKPVRALAGKPLVVRPGGLGDLVCADIALQTLGLDARDFNWLIEARSQPWAMYRGMPHLCYEHTPAKSLKKIVDRYDLVINSEQFYGLTQAYALLARSRHGRLVAFETNRGAPWADVSVPYDWKDRHETQEFARLFATALDLPDSSGPRLMRPRMQDSSAPPLVLVAGLQSRSRRLSLEAWSVLIAKWHRHRKFLVAAAPEDSDFARRLVQRFDRLAAPFTGSFDQLCDQIARSEEMFTMDGGGVHIASFFGIPTLAIFTSGRNRKWSPLGEGSKILRRHELACQPCTKYGQVPKCPNLYACQKLDDVKPSKVS